MAVRDLGLSHVVLTSVTRDDLEDEGAAHFVETIRQCRQLNPKTRVEVLTPDFHAREDVFEKLRAAPPDIFNHNLETVERLQNKIRPLASWTTSLKCLALARKVLGSDTLSKTGIMVGLGETDEEVVETMRACAEQNIDIFNVGQYLQPSRRHMAPKRYVHPDVFEGYREEGMKLGFKYVFSGPYVRSSYMADHQTTHSFPEFP
jgi:lipoic acid synthetase